MTQEEKAKAYDEALEKAKELLDSPRTCFDIEQLKDIFPELAESEDEKTRKELLEEIESIIPHEDETDSEGLILPSYHTRIDRYKSYLEKQKEQKPADYNEYKMLIDGAREIVIKMHPCLKDCTILGDRLTRGELMALVKAGAEWQRKHSPLPEDTVLFLKGVEEGKRLMMEEAVGGEIGYWNQRGLSIRLDKSLERLGYDIDTKVKIVIVKEDDRPRD